MGIQEDIDRLTKNFAAAVTAKDLDAMSSFYEEGARFLAPGAPMATGRDEIRQAQRDMIARGVQSLDLEAVDLIEAGDFFIEIGRVTVAVARPGAPAVTDHGKSVVVWRRQPDGTLKIVVDILNSDSMRP